MFDWGDLKCCGKLIKRVTIPLKYQFSNSNIFYAKIGLNKRLKIWNITFSTENWFVKKYFDYISFIWLPIASIWLHVIFNDTFMIWIFELWSLNFEFSSFCPFRLFLLVHPIYLEFLPNKQNLYKIMLQFIQVNISWSCLTIQMSV